MEGNRFLVGGLVMNQEISDDTIRHLAADAMRLYHGFDEIYAGHVIEAVMRHLPPDFDRRRVSRIVYEFVG